MIKQAPGIGRLVAMALFTISVFAILMSLWMAFGGEILLKPQSYRFKVHMPEAATLAEEADVRMAGVNVGKVKTTELDAGAARTIVEIELEEPYAPIAKDTRAILRQKTLLGETYVELSPGHRSKGDAGRRPAGELARRGDRPARRDLLLLRSPDARRVPGLGQGAGGDRARWGGGP